MARAGHSPTAPDSPPASTTVMRPLAVGGSRVGGLFYYPLARTVMGGMMSSAVFTLLVLPYLMIGVEAVAR